jgi:hypothetical protein
MAETFYSSIGDRYRVLLTIFTTCNQDHGTVHPASTSSSGTQLLAIVISCPYQQAAVLASRQIAGAVE